MKLYRIEYLGHEDEELVHYQGTKSEAHGWVKDNVAKTSWLDATITEIDYAVDKAGMVAALNGEPVRKATFAVWGLTARGGLKVEWA